MYDPLFLLPLSISFVVAVVILIALVLWNKKRKLIEERTEIRHLHKNGISRFGGVAMIIAFVFTISVDQKLVISAPLLGVLLAAMAILIFGVIDDLKQLSWKAQLLFQITVVLFIYLMGVKLQFITNPFGGIFLFSNNFGMVLSLGVTIIWVVFLMNAMNWIDGMDGTVGGVSFIGILTIFFLSLRPEVNQPPIGIVTASILGALAAFMFFNFYPAKIMAGTSGSMFLGFVLAILAIFSGAKIATTLLVLTVPIVDALWVMGQRLRAGDSIFAADRRHLHYRLLEIGWTQWDICVFYYCITAVVAVIALNTHALGKLVAFLVFASVIVGILLGISKKTIDAQ